jgi:hypothetical protein
MAHVALENKHNLDGVMATFGSHGFLDDAQLGMKTLNCVS